MTSKIEFLAQLSTFQALNEQELASLAKIAQEYEFEKGGVIAYQRDIADSLYIVREGRLFAKTVDAAGVVREGQGKAYEANECFGDAWLFAADVHPATVIASENGRLLIVKGNEFMRFLDKNPGLLKRLEPMMDDAGNVVSGLSVKGWQEAQKVRARANRQSNAISLLPDELVEYQARRSRWYLFIQVLIPVLGLILLPLPAYWLLSGLGESWGTVAAITAVLLSLFFLALLLIRLLDWSNDYFVITNKRLVHREFNLLTFHVNDMKIPIEQVQSVEITKPSLIANLFDIGTARITTAAQQGTLYFDNIDNPSAVKEALDRLGQRVKALDAGLAQAAMRQSIEGYFQLSPFVRQATDPDAPAQPAATAKAKSSPLVTYFKWRTEEGGIITYRKHIFILFEQITRPVIAGFLMLILVYVLLNFFEFTLGEIVLVFSILFLADLGWLIWNVEDWRNDTYQVTNRSVIDIDRMPFGFRESRKEAALGNIQNVKADRPGLLPTLFNYGRVVVETAGAKSDIIFEDVPNPSQVQTDIFQQLEQLRARQRVQEGEQRRKEYAVLVDVYKQATELNRIPRRTPD